MSRVLPSALLGCSLFIAAPAAQGPPRDAPPAYVEAARQEAALRDEIAAQGLTVERALRLARLQETRGSAEAETTLQGARKLFPADEPLIMALAGYYTRSGKPAQAIAQIEELARLRPGDARPHYMIATWYEEMVRKGRDLPKEEKLAHVMNGIAAVDRVLALDEKASDALAYKNILLRHRAALEDRPEQQRALLQEADALRARAMELQKERSVSAAPGGAPPRDPLAPPPPPPPPPPGVRQGCDPVAFPEGQAPVRVGGNIKPPTKTVDARPVYPDAAREARVQGVVIIEALINPDGTVGRACVLRSIPLLDEAAVEAVRQWQFTPTLLNGVAVPVMMTVTVNFTMQ